MKNLLIIIISAVTFFSNAANLPSESGRTQKRIFRNAGPTISVVEDWLNFDSGSSSDPTVSIVIYDISGDIVFFKEDCSGQFCTADLASLDSGIHIIYGFTRNAQVVVKIVR